jgi:hypothetical protein
MKRLFYAGVVLLVIFEAANLYFIMPLPGSQRMQSIDLAYFLFSWRWGFRALLSAMTVAGGAAAFQRPAGRSAIAGVSVVIAGVIVYAFNFQMSADHIFLEATSVRMQPAERNAVDLARLVVGIDIDGDARAYPLQFIGYHHQVRDTAGGRAVMVSYCTVCRTGRVWSPIVDGRVETFRLVGMDHFNAMFEDRTTRSWWRQATGQAITGPMKGKLLTEIPSVQVTLAQWLALHPKSLIMQPDSTMLSRYPTTYAYELGSSRSTLTGTDTASWHEKSWVVGITLKGESKAYDWNRLRKERAVNDVVGGTPVVVALSLDGASYFAFQRPDTATRFVARGDSLVTKGRAYALAGHALSTVPASQEFWHSWRTFHPGTGKY